MTLIKTLNKAIAFASRRAGEETDLLVERVLTDFATIRSNRHSVKRGKAAMERITAYGEFSFQAGVQYQHSAIALLKEMKAQLADNPGDSILHVIYLSGENYPEMEDEDPLAPIKEAKLGGNRGALVAALRSANAVIEWLPRETINAATIRISSPPVKTK